MKNRIFIIVAMLVLVLTLTACATDVVDGDNSALPDVSTPDVENSAPDDEVAPPEDDAPPPDKPTETIPLIPLVKYDTWLIADSTKVNIREQPSSSARVVGTIRRGEGLGFISRVAEKWYKVYYKGKQAYISSSFVRMVSTPKSANNNIERIIVEGKKLLGYPYVWGSQRYHWGNGILNKNFRMGEFDCSALMQYMFYKGARINLDVTTRSQVYQGKLVRDNIERGDLMFFTNAYRRHKKGVDRVGHVAIYLGDNYILHTATDYALIEEISHDRWNNYLVSKRFF